MPKGSVGTVKVDVLNGDMLARFAEVLGETISDSIDRQAAATEKLSAAVEELSAGQERISARVDGIVGSLRDQTKTIARSVKGQKERARQMMIDAKKVAGNDPDPSR